MSTDRRTFLQLLGSGAFAAALPSSIARALEIPANNRTGTIADVEHIVILMQENRSFDHYFGTMRGVRGFSDPRAVKLPSGQPVWNQPNGSDVLLPFHPTASNLGLQFEDGTPHDWNSTHGAWNQGNYDQWVPNKGTTTMVHLTRQDIPFHYALADAFTVCDAYHCSLLGPTDPNRYHMWTGWVGNDGLNGGPVLDNSELGYDWSTYPEKLQKAGVSWKIYQDQGAGLDAADFWGWGSDAYMGNYGDNSLLYFHQYQNAPATDPLALNARTGTNISAAGGDLAGERLFDILRQDVLNNTLPQVSWIVAPEAYTEHANWPANYGAWYTSQVLDALTANPDVWSKTVFFLNYDENDGFFDHVIPPTPPFQGLGKSTVDTTNEIYNQTSAYYSDYVKGPIGLGVRVPMVVISPWSKGGYVNSQVFDHTSLIRFIETRFGSTYPGITETNITTWRRAVAGDLTSAFNFARPNHGSVSLPSTDTYKPTDNLRHPSYVPTPPTDQSVPAQEPGQRPARALPYELNATGKVNLSNGSFGIRFENTGDAAVVFHVRSGSGSAGPWSYTVGAGASVSDAWSGQPTYDLSVYGPNGFFREFKGSLAGSGNAHLDVRSSYNPESLGISLQSHNRSGKTVQVSILDVYSNQTVARSVEGGDSVSHSWSLRLTAGWYDLVITSSDASFQQHLAGHVENGRDSMSDPAIGAAGDV
jgi:phospholipase C